MPLHLSEFQKEQMQGYIENVPVQKQYLLSNFLPKRETKDINFSYGVIDGRYAKSASITGFNATAPLRDPKELSKAFGSVAKVQHGQRLDEEQLLHFNRPRDDQERAQVIDYVYDLTEELVEGVYDIEEYLRAQAVYNGVLNYEDTENDVKISVDFNIPSENKIDVTTAWSDEGATPLTDLQSSIKQFKKANNNKKPIVIHMTESTEAILLTNKQIRNQIHGDDSNRLVTKADLENVFTALGFPPYQVYDDVVDVAGVGQVQLLEDDKVVLLGDDIGETVVGPTVENNYNSGIYVVPEIKETNPPSQAVFVGETVFPAIKKPGAIVHLNTKL